MKSNAKSNRKEKVLLRLLLGSPLPSAASIIIIKPAVTAASIIYINLVYTGRELESLYRSPFLRFFLLPSKSAQAPYHRFRKIWLTHYKYNISFHSKLKLTTSVNKALKQQNSKIKTWPRQFQQIHNWHNLTVAPVFGFLCINGGPLIWFHIWPERKANITH